MAKILKATKPYTIYYDDGSIEEKGFKDSEGNQQGRVVRYFPSGQMQFEGEYDSEKGVQGYKWYFEDGNLDRESIVDLDEPYDEKFTKYRENGTIEQIIYWLNDNMEKIIDYDEDGNTKEWSP